MTKITEVNSIIKEKGEDKKDNKGIKIDKEEEEEEGEEEEGEMIEIEEIDNKLKKSLMLINRRVKRLKTKN